MVDPGKLRHFRATYALMYLQDYPREAYRQMFRTTSIVTSNCNDCREHVLFHCIKSSNLGNPLSALIELDPLSSQERILQSTTNNQTLNSQFQLHRHGLVLQNTGNKLIRLRGKRILKSLPVFLRHGVADTLAIRHLDVVRPRDKVHHDLAIGTGDFGADVVTMGLRARAVEVCDLTAPEFNNTDAVVDVFQLGEFWVVLDGADSESRLGDKVFAHVPQ